MISSTLLHVAKPYEQALSKVLEVRANRQQLYGDDWKKSTDTELYVMIKEKFNRLTRFVMNPNLKTTYEKKVDTLIDLINWSLFMLQNNLEKENKNV